MTRRRNSAPLPYVLQWNDNGLRTRLLDIRLRVREYCPDVIALQETNTLLVESRISQYTEQHSEGSSANGRPKASIYVRASHQQLSVDCGDSCSDAAEYAGVVMPLGQRDVTVVSVYVRSAVTWYPNTIRRI